MTRSEPAGSAVLAIAPVLVAALFLAMGTAIVLPQPAAAQCADCMLTGLGGEHWPGPNNGFGIGQPGGELSCADSPEGMTDCEQGIDWCETSGSVCSALMFLDFTEDGVAYGRTLQAPPTEESQVRNAEARLTCDGILLRGVPLHEEIDQKDDVLTMAL